MNRVVLITGASSGLGLALAEEFTRNGDIVYGTSRHEWQEDVPFRKILLDVNDTDSCKNAVEQVVEQEGYIDILINNAGFGIAGPIEFTSEEEMAQIAQTNVFGAVRMNQFVLPHMRNCGGGLILHISSVAAAVPLPFQAFYSAGKAALEHISQAMDMECRPFSIHSVCVEFGDMKTGFTKNRKKTVMIDSAYSEAFHRSLARMEHDEQNGPPPQKAARFVWRISGKKHPKPVYVYGTAYRLIVWMRRILPNRFTHFIIRKLYS